MMSVDIRTYTFTKEQASIVQKCIDILDDAFVRERHDHERSCLFIAFDSLLTVMSVYDLWDEKQ